MMKRFTSLAAAAIVAAVGLSPAWGQDVQGEDYTSHLANPSFTEGAGTQPGDTIATNGRGNIYVPAGWTLVYTNTVPTWDRQFIRYADIENPPGGSLDDFQTPLLAPQDGDGYYFFHGITGAGVVNEPYTLTQTLTDLPSGRYILKYYAALKVRAADILNPEPLMRVTTSVGDTDEPIEVFMPDTTMSEWPAEDELEFVVLTDNDTVTLGMYYEAPSYAEQHVYLDNFRLYRLGDVTELDIINSTKQETEAFMMELAAKHVEIEYQYLPGDWDNIMYDYEQPQTMDTVSSIQGAQAFQQQVLLWISRMDSLITYRTMEIPMWNDSLQTLITEAKYEGIEALQTQLDANKALLEAATYPQDFVTALAASKQAAFDYNLNGLMSLVTYDEPTDFTSFFIVNPTCEGERQRVDPEGWTVISVGSTQPYLYGSDRQYADGTTNPGTYFNTWGTSGEVEFTAMQTIENIPVGIYTLRASIAGDGNQGTYLFAKVGDDYYYTEVPRNDTRMDTMYVENILVLNENTSLTIGFTNQADTLWADAHASDATYISADDFALFYQGSDPSALKGVLEEAIAEMEAYLTDTEEGAAALKGDVTAVQAVIAEARETAQGTDFAAYGRALSNLNAQYTIITASATAAGNVQTTMDEANALIQESGSKMTDAKAPLETEVTIAATWLESDDAVTADAEALIDNILAAIEVAEDSIRSWEKQHLVVGDATACLVNPTIEDGTKGYHMDAFGGAYIVSASDFFADNHTHLCFWSGGAPADSVGFDMYQNVGNIPSGYYRMTAMAVVGANEPNNIEEFSNGNVVFYAIGDVDHEVQVPLHHAIYESGDTLTFSSSGRLDSTYNYYSNQPYQYVLDRILVNHGEFRFGMKTIGPMNINTARIYNFTLEYLEPVDYEPYPDAIEEVGADAAELKAYAQNGYIIVETDEPYTIVSVNGGVVPDTDAQLVPGVYIVRAGSKTVKVVVD